VARRGTFLAWALSAAVVGVAARFADATPEARALWDKSLEVQRLPDVRSEIVLTTTDTAGHSVTLKVHGVGVLQNNAVKRSLMSRVVSGGGLVGTGFLSIEHVDGPTDLWVYLPSLGWPRRLLGSNLGDSYLGSEFRYGDLVQPEPAAYAATVKGVDTIDDRRHWSIETVPMDAALARNTGLSREVRWLEQESLVERRVEQYDRRGKLLKVLDNERWMQSAGGKWLPRQRTIRNVQTGTTSTALFENVEVGVGLPQSIFVPNSLGDRSW
jgi:uncharacterized protein